MHLIAGAILFAALCAAQNVSGASVKGAYAKEGGVEPPIGVGVGAGVGGRVRMITSPTGRQVDIATLERYFPARTPLHGTRVAGALYEVTPQLRLLGEGVDVDLSAAAPSVREVAARPGAPVFVDGVRRDDVAPRVFLRTASASAGAGAGGLGGLVVAQTEHGDVLAVWGDGRALVPVDHVAHRGLLFDAARLAGTRATAAQPASLRGDAVPAARGSNRSSAFGTAARQGATCRDRLPAKEVEVAVAFDGTYCERYGGDAGRAVSSIRALLAAASEPYEASTCLRLSAATIEAHCGGAQSSDDPYSALRSRDAAGILEGFRTMWLESKADVKRDVAYLVSGFDDGSSTAGRAYVGVACSMEVGFGWAEGNNPAILAHELGHTLGADHDASGLMQGVLGPAEGMEFSSASVDAIAAFVDDPDRAACLTAPKKEKKNDPSPVPEREPKPSREASPTPSMSSMPSSMPAPSERPNPSASPSSAEPEAPSKPKTPSPSPAPSEKTRSEPKPERSPESTPGATCLSAIPKGQLFGCRAYGDIGQLVARSGSLHARVRQYRGTIDVQLNAVNETGTQVTVTKAYVRVSTLLDARGGHVDFSKHVELSGDGTDVLTVSVHPAQLAPPPDAPSCCGRPLYVFVAAMIRGRPAFAGVTLSDAADDGVASAAFQTDMLCEDPCESDDYGSPVVLDNGCPACEMT